MKIFFKIFDKALFVSTNKMVHFVFKDTLKWLLKAGLYSIFILYLFLMGSLNAVAV